MEWIHIKDRKPNKHQKVLVLAHGKFIEQGEYDEHCHDELVDSCCGQILFAEYWIPMPDIPLPNQPERSKREDSQKPLYCGIRCLGESLGIYQIRTDKDYCENKGCSNNCFSSKECEMRCSEHCGNTVRDK